MVTLRDTITVARLDHLGAISAIDRSGRDLRQLLSRNAPSSGPARRSRR